MTPDADLDCDGYRILAMVQGSIGMPPVRIGTPGRCRFCGTSDRRAFRNVAHSLPEALGNRWITSLDECDACNARFGALDDALAKSVGAVLTVGGVAGKTGKVRQTGRTAGPSSIRHDRVDGRRSISVRVDGSPLGDHVGFDTVTGEIVFRIPVGTERLVPARAYGALVKMAVALLPLEELADFSRIVDWLGKPDAALLPNMIVGMSFASVGNAPPLASAALLRRTEGSRDVPHTIFVTSIGSVCLQVVLRPDAHDGGWRSPLRTRPAIRWSNVLAPPGHEPIVLDYGVPVHLDWGRVELEPPAIEALVMRVHPSSGQGRIEPVLRADAIAPCQSA